MFTGLVQAVAPILELDGVRLRLPSPFGGVGLGESVAVNGCCLTVAETGEELGFELSPETLARTAFEYLRKGALLNLERALRVGDRLGGHFVQGHVDAVGRLVSRETANCFERFRFEVAAPLGMLVDKGSIALDGVSLTVVRPEGTHFDVWLVPHTLSHTNLGAMQPGGKVNVEFDMVAKHLAALAQPYRGVLA